MSNEQPWVSSRYTAADARDSLGLLRNALGESEATASACQEWQCQRSPGGTAIASLAREAETGRLIGQAVTIPMRVRVAGKVRLASLALDPVVDPSRQGRTVLAGLLRKVSTLSAEEGIAFTYGFPNQASYSTFLNQAGFRSVGAVPLLLRPLNPERLAMKTAHSPTPAKAASVARRVWRTSEPVARPEALPGLEIAQVASFDSSFKVFWDRVEHRFPVMVVRDPAYLNWRFADVPMREYKTFAARSEGEIRGFIVLRVAPLGEFAAGFIVDLIVETSAEGRAAGRLLIDQAYSYFKERDLDLLASLALRHTDEFRLLRSMGFWVCPKFLEPRPFRLVVRSHEEERSPSRLAYELRNWFVTMGDYDGG